MEKSPEAFRTISEVADWLGVPTHVLRFWESRFAQVKPVKRAGGRRYYRPSDMELLGGIKRLLHDDGMTIRGVQKLLREQGIRHIAGLSQPLFPEVEDAEIVEEAATPVDGDVVEFPKDEDVPVEATSGSAADEIDESLATADAAATPEELDIVPRVPGEPLAEPEEPAPAEKMRDVAEAVSPEPVHDVDEVSSADPAEADLIDLMASTKEDTVDIGGFKTDDQFAEDPDDDEFDDDSGPSVTVRLRLADPDMVANDAPEFRRAHSKLVALRDRMDSRNPA